MGDAYFKGLRLMFLPNVPGATFIPGALSIPESRVVIFLTKPSNWLKNSNKRKHIKISF